MMRRNPFNLILRVLLISGAAIDFLLGLLILFAPGFLSRTLMIPLAAEMFYLWMIGLLLIGLALAYILGGIDPAKYFGNIALAATMRLGIGVFLIIVVAVGQAPGIFQIVGYMEIALGLVHAFYTVRLFGTNPEK
jgi:hypothetical protein